MKNPLRCGVIGVGYLGRFHAEKYQMLPNIELVGICDANPQRLQEISTILGVNSYPDHLSLLDQIDAVSIVTSTKEHFKIAADCLSRGIHVLLEKPMTETVEEAQILIDLAKRNNVKLQIGHIERFNATHLALQPFIDHPLFIEAIRLAPFNTRGADVNVILDLMIHDIDLVCDIAQSPVIDIQAQGASVITATIDLASATLTFLNGCIATLTSSRINPSPERKIRIIQQDNYISADYHLKKCTLFKKETLDTYPVCFKEHEVLIEPHDALLSEIRSFTASIQQDRLPKISGEQGQNALNIAQIISKKIIEKQSIPIHS